MQKQVNKETPKIMKLEDIVGDVILINMEDVSFIRTNLDEVDVKFKNGLDEYKFLKITEKSIKKLKEGIK